MCEEEWYLSLNYWCLVSLLVGLLTADVSSCLSRHYTVFVVKKRKHGMWWTKNIKKWEQLLYAGVICITMLIAGFMIVRERVYVDHLHLFCRLTGHFDSIQSYIHIHIIYSQHTGTTVVSPLNGNTFFSFPIFNISLFCALFVLTVLSLKTVTSLIN